MSITKASANASTNANDSDNDNDNADDRDDADDLDDNCVVDRAAPMRFAFADPLIICFAFPLLFIKAPWRNLLPIVVPGETY